VNRRLLALASVVAASSLAVAPAHAATKKKPKPKPITKTFTMQLLPVPDPPQGTTCTDPRLEGVGMHSERLKTSGPGVLFAKVTGFSGDWDITVTDASDNSVEDVGSGTSTGGGAPAQNGTDTVTIKFKKAADVFVRYCNFAGTPQATGSYRFTYS
jgi:hypothetical protein